MDLEELNKQIKAEVDLMNNRPLDEFDGRTPREMFYILNDPFHMDSPLQFKNKIDKDVLDKIPFLKLTSIFLNQLKEQQPLKLTVTGNLPLKLVRFLYDTRLFPSESIDSGFSSIRSENDMVYVHIMRLLCEITGLMKKQKGKLSLTRKGNSLLKDENLFELFKKIFIAYTTKYNWPYNDRYGDHPLGQLGCAFSLELVSKYGHKLLPASFYAEKYITAFPKVLEQIEEPFYWTLEEEANNCYELRTFNHFMEIFGFVEIVEMGEDKFGKRLFVKKSSILDLVIGFNG